MKKIMPYIASAILPAIISCTSTGPKCKPLESLLNQNLGNVAVAYVGQSAPNQPSKLPQMYQEMFENIQYNSVATNLTNISSFFQTPITKPYDTIFFIGVDTPKSKKFFNEVGTSTGAEIYRIYPTYEKMK